MAKPKHIGNTRTDRFELDVYECDGGLHIGIDSTYVGQVADVNVKKLCNDFAKKRFDI